MSTFNVMKESAAVWIIHVFFKSRFGHNGGLYPRIMRRERHRKAVYIKRNMHGINDYIKIRNLKLFTS